MPTTMPLSSTAMRRLLVGGPNERDVDRRELRVQGARKSIERPTFLDRLQHDRLRVEIGDCGFGWIDRCKKVLIDLFSRPLRLEIRVNGGLVPLDPVGWQLVFVDEPKRMTKLVEYDTLQFSG